MYILYMPDIYMETVVQHKDSKYLICCIEFISICNIYIG